MHVVSIDPIRRSWRAVLTSHPGWLAVALLTLMFALGATSLKNDSATFDEVAHIPAGYAYVRYGDFRLNPEHPPLIKDLAGVALQFLSLRFPDHDPAWTTQMNGQWEVGRQFLYTMGNDADRILLWARIPVLLFAIAFGAFVYEYCRRRWGSEVALLVLFFYTLSPNFLAHARYVTTDVGASAFTFLALVTFAHFVEKPGARSTSLLGVTLGFSQFVKFSSISIYPFLVAMTLLVIAIWPRPERPWERIKLYGGGLIASYALSVCVLWLLYYPHTFNMPVSVQDRLIVGSMIPGTLEPLAHRLLVVNKVPLMVPLVQYVLGVTMVLARVKIGTWTYFNGEVIKGSFRAYFPEVFLLKTQIAFLILCGVAIAVLVRTARQPRVLRPLPALAAHWRRHFLLWVMAAFSVFYFGLAVAGHLNLGVRHILPIYVPLFILVAVAVVELLRQLASTAESSGRIACWLLAALLTWYAGSALLIHPAYTAYFNEFIGGPNGGDRYFAGSSVDWGQDLRRLRDYTSQHPEIQRLAVDYFGGGDVRYYFCKHQQRSLAATAFDCSGSVYDEGWTPEEGPYPGQYIAVSETTLAGDPLFGNHYAYLRDRSPIAKIGYSINLYKLR